jgi:hypothetical protein
MCVTVRMTADDPSSEPYISYPTCVSTPLEVGIRVRDMTD